MSYPNNPPVPASITVDTTASINSGLVGFWPLTDGTGTTAKDLSGYGNDASASGTVNWLSGDVGMAADFASVTGYFDTGVGTSTLGVSGGSTASISAWVNYTTGGSVTQNVFGDLGSGGAAPNFGMYINRNITFVDVWRNEVNARFNFITLSAWMHLVAVYDASNIYLYINGSLHGTIAVSGSINASTGNCMIGNQPANNRDLEGQLQNIRVYNRALTATEVAELYSVPWTGTDYVAQNLTPDTPIAMGVDPNHSLSSGLVGYWPLSEGSGSSPGDISGNSETLTNGGSSVWATKEVGAVAVVNGNAGKYYSTDSSFSTMIGGSTPATDPWSISLWASLYLTAPYEYEAGFLSIGSSSADGTPF